MGTDYRGMSDIELAKHMSGYREGTKEHILCQQEFARRQGSSSARRSRIAIWISVGAFLLAALSALITIYGNR